MWRRLKPRAPSASARVTATAILVNLLNPKLSIFFLAFLPQFVGAAETAPIARMLELSAVSMGMTFVVFAGYGLFAAALRDRVVTRPRVLAWLRRSFAAAFVGLGNGRWARSTETDTAAPGARRDGVEPCRLVEEKGYGTLPWRGAVAS